MSEKYSPEDEEYRLTYGIYTDEEGNRFFPTKTGASANEPIPNQEIEDIFREAQGGVPSQDLYGRIPRLNPKAKPNRDKNNGYHID